MMKRWQHLSMVGLAVSFPVIFGASALAEEASSQGRTESKMDERGPAVSLSLDEALRAALEKNLDISVQRYEPQISETLIDTELSVFEPFLNAFGVAGEDNSPQTDFLSGGFVSSTRDKTFGVSYVDPMQFGSTFQFDLFTNRHVNVGTGQPNFVSYFSQATATFTQPLLRNFGRNVNRTRIVIAQNNNLISKSQFRQTVMDTLAATESAYWDLNFSLMDLKTELAALNQAQDFLEQTQVKVRVGTLPPIEITQAEAEVADREQAVIVAKHLVLTSEDNLRQFMSIPADSPMWSQPIQPTNTPEVLEKIVDLNEAIQTAMENRPDLEQARLGLSNKETDLLYRKNQRRYKLDLVARYGATGLTRDTCEPVDPSLPFDPITNPCASPLARDPLSNLPDTYDEIRFRDRSTWSARLNLGIPLGNRAAQAAYASSKFDLDQAQTEIQRLEEQILVDVRGAVRRVESNLRSVRAAEVNTRLQREKLEAEQKKYENGMSTAFQILQFQTDLTEAERRLNLSMVGYNKALVDLDQTLGILLDTRNVTLD